KNANPMRTACAAVLSPRSRELRQSGERLGHRATGRPVEQFDRVHNGDRGAGGKLRDAADIASRDCIRLETFDVGNLALTQLLRQRGLEDIVGARRTAA